MSIARSLPAGSSHLLNHDQMKFLPAFVRARLQYLADMLDWSFYEEEDEEEESVMFTYYEIQGKLSDGLYNANQGEYIAPINLWIAGDDNCHRSFYTGGSSCWICPDNHYLFFDHIDPTLLPEHPNCNEWWCIQYEEDIKVIKIQVRPSEEIAEDFPNGV